MEKKTIAGLIAVVAIVAVAIFAGCMEKSAYRVEYSWGAGYLCVNISGPADDIAVIVTDPTGDTDVRTISKEDLIDNFETVEFYPNRNPSPGTYKLVVKTITPEKVVYKTERNFKGADIRITDAEIKLKRDERQTIEGYVWGYIDKYSVIVENKGDLPFETNDVIIHIDIDGKQFESMTFGWVIPHGKLNITESGFTLGDNYVGHQPTTAKIDLYSYSRSTGEKGEKVASSEARIIIEV